MQNKYEKLRERNRQCTLVMRMIPCMLVDFRSWCILCRHVFVEMAPTAIHEKSLMPCSSATQERSHSLGESWCSVPSGTGAKCTEPSLPLATNWSELELVTLMAEILHVVKSCPYSMPVSRHSQAVGWDRAIVIQVSVPPIHGSRGCQQQICCYPCCITWSYFCFSRL